MGCGASSNVKHDLHMSHESVSLNEEERQPETPMHPEPSPLASPFATQAEHEMEKGPIKLEDLEEWERNELTRDLRNAIMKGDMEELSRLLSSDKWMVCINEEDQDGQTPLHHAVAYAKLEAVQLLVEKGANVEAVSDVAGTPLTLAAKNGFAIMADYLLQRGANKQMAIQSAASLDMQDVKALVKSFFDELERVGQLRPELEAKREELKATMTSSDKTETLPTTCKGITIGGLKKMKESIQSECEAGRFKEDKSFPDGTHCKGTVNYEELTTTDVVYRYVKDEIITGDRRFADAGVLVGDFFTIPSLFISHAWKGRFSRLVDEILAYARKKGLTDSYSVWMDMWAVNQVPSASDFSLNQNQEDVRAFQSVLQTCIDGTLVVCDFEICETYTRCWCLYEWDWTMFYHGRDRLHFVGLTDDQACKGAEGLDVDQAECFKAEDKTMIIEQIVKKHGSTATFNDKLQLKMVDVFYSLNSRVSKPGHDQVV